MTLSLHYSSLSHAQNLHFNIMIFSFTSSFFSTTRAMYSVLYVSRIKNNNFHFPPFFSEKDGYRYNTTTTSWYFIILDVFFGEWLWLHNVSISIQWGKYSQKNIFFFIGKLYTLSLTWPACHKMMKRKKIIHHRRKKSESSGMNLCFWSLYIFNVYYSAFSHEARKEMMDIPL